MGVNDTIYDTIGKHWKTGAVIQVGKYKMRRSLVEPTIGLEPMTCRLRIGRWCSRKLGENKGRNNQKRGQRGGQCDSSFCGG